MDKTINKVVNDLVEALNISLKKYNIGYGEDLHNAILKKFNDIGEESYRRWLGK